MNGRKPGMRLEKALIRLLLVCLLLIPSSSCVTDDDYWTFRVTRTVWSQDGFLDGPAASCEVWAGSGGEAVVVLGILFVGLPLAIDLVLLPITLTHDLVYVH